MKIRTNVALLPPRLSLALFAMLVGVQAVALTPSACAAKACPTWVEEDPKPLPTIDEATEGMKHSDGFLPFYWDPVEGRILAKVTCLDKEFLYIHSLATGLGSNPVGLDRGQLGSQKIVRFKRIGPKVLMLQTNLRFRADSSNPFERRAVEQSFAQSVVWGGKIKAESDGQILIDLTSLLMTDMQGVVQTLDRTGQGSFSVDQDRSAVHLPACKAFPDNTELEATLTFASSKPGALVRQTTPTPTSVSLRQHHSFVRLPDDEYQPRRYDVRAPSIFITFADYATPLDSELQKRWITRHRLKKKNPMAAMSVPETPIVYYIDPGAPKEIQAALMEGAMWWNEAFESAGFINAFQVKPLPAHADPLDVRYNVIQWVHRSTRGWSYGGSVIDPRTGEIIKGHVTLGSLRVRQDQRLVDGLQSSGNSAANSCGAIGGVAEESTLATLAGSDPLEVALARIRQLSAHEVGHTLGFVHNFAASTYGDRASVMDYPAPRVKIVRGKLDLSDAYAVGIGDWDKISVQYAYREFAAGEDESAQLNKILQTAADQGMIFISDADARPAHAAQPLGNLWDNGADPIAELNHVMRVRKIALENFDPRDLPAETTTADIAQYLTPVFLHHRYQLNAVGKVIGGYNYRYATVRESDVAKQAMSWPTQSSAVNALLETIRPAALVIGNPIAESISPRPYQAIRDAEITPGKAGRIFDPIAAAEVACQLTLDELLQPQRLARLALQSQSAGGDAWRPRTWIPGLAGRVITNSLSDSDEAEKQIGQMVCEMFLERLIEISDDSSVNLDVRLGCLDAIAQFSGLVVKATKEESFRRLIQRRTQQALNRPMKSPSPRQKLDPPPGSPIGAQAAN